MADYIETGKGLAEFMDKHRNRVRCQCIECGDKDEVTEATIRVFIERLGKGVYCVSCGENAVFPMKHL